MASPSLDIGFGNGLDEVSLEDKFYFFDLWFERVPLKQQPRLERMLLLRRWSPFYSNGSSSVTKGENRKLLFSPWIKVSMWIKNTVEERSPKLVSTKLNCWLEERGLGALEATVETVNQSGSIRCKHSIPIQCKS